MKMSNLKSLGRQLMRDEMKQLKAGRNTQGLEGAGSAECTCTDDDRQFTVPNCGTCLELCRGGYWCFGGNY